MTIDEVIQDVENPQFNIEVVVRERQAPTTNLGMRRVYASEWDDYHKTPRIYIFPKGESILENFFIGRHNRPYQMYRERILPTVFEELGWDISIIRVRWSQKAGCSCPCSPGFVVTKPTLKNPHDVDEWLAHESYMPPKPPGFKYDDGRPYDVFVTISPKGGQDD